MGIFFFKYRWRSRYISYLISVCLIPLLRPLLVLQLLFFLKGVNCPTYPPTLLLLIFFFLKGANCPTYFFLFPSSSSSPSFSSSWKVLIALIMPLLHLILLLLPYSPCYPLRSVWTISNPFLIHFRWIFLIEVLSISVTFLIQYFWPMCDLFLINPFHFRFYFWSISEPFLINPFHFPGRCSWRLCRRSWPRRTQPTLQPTSWNWDTRNRMRYETLVIDDGNI